jgi:hypothetical protein
MTPTVSKSAPGDTAGVWTNERCFIVETWNHPSDPGVALARARVPPGVTTAKHRLGVDERYLIEKGRGRVELDDRNGSTSGRRGAHPGTRRSAFGTRETRTSSSSVCTPRFEPRHYEDRESEA